MDSDPNDSELYQTLTYILNNQDTTFCRNKEKFQWAQLDFMTCIKEATYWLKTKFIGSMLSFLTIVFAIFLCLCHRKMNHVALMAPDEIQQVYRTEAAQPHTTPWQNIFNLPPFPH